MDNSLSFFGGYFTPSILFCVLNVMIGTIFLASKLKSNNHSQHHDSPGQLARSPSLLQRVRSFNFSHYNHGHREEERLDDSQSQLSGTPSRLGRAPSLLDRVRSFNFSHYNFSHHEEEELNNSQSQLNISPSGLNEPPSRVARAPSLLDRVRSFRFTSERTPPQQYDQTDDVSERHVMRSVSDKCEPSRPAEEKTSTKMKKSASERTMMTEEDNEEEIERRRPATVRERKARGAKTTAFQAGDEVDARADDFISKFKQQLKLQRVDSLLRYKEMLNRGAN